MEAYKDSDVCVRMNCPGGSVYDAYGMYAKYAEHPKTKKIKVDGQAKSAGCMFLFYADEVTCLDVTDFMLHRAAFPSWLENDKEAFTEEMKAQLIKMNNSLRAALEAKVSSARFAAITGVSLDDVFSLDKRVDVNFNAQQALQMGLVSKIIPLTSDIKKEIDALASSYGVAAFSKEPKINQPKNTVMTKAEIKSQFPQAYNEILAAGAAAEKTRVNAWMKFMDIDAKATKEGIASGASVDMEVMAEMTVKAVSNKQVSNLQEDSAKPVATPDTNAPKEEPKTENQATFEALVAEGLEALGLKN